MRGVTITFDHRWLLERMLFAQRAPVIWPYRGFVVDRIEPDVDRDYVVDFPNCRMMISYAEVRELAMVVDSLTDIVRESLLGRERAWDATDFPFVKRGGGTSVAIAALSVRVWREIIQFAHAHDAREGDSLWHMFDPSPNVLKALLTRTTDDIDSGYHGILYVTEELDGFVMPMRSWCFGSPTIWVCKGKSRLADGDLAHMPVNGSLMNSCPRPIVGPTSTILGERYATCFHLDGPNVRCQLDEMFVARDLRQRPLLRDGTWHQDIVETCERIQAFFSVRKDPVPFV
ncbi:hypothetical protein BDI4_970016 [Burkholderia diffusa]|uniref:hypothetical protein n=1 Tax=Burkholderia diffusa TaxID=488732 RepID=UPI001CB4521F|nr:hypothetical protein [Burkholderia diffusa]CAG9266206.1 hypothetical protein BDI4_970016 [Burkholderia diffusa]